MDLHNTHTQCCLGQDLFTNMSHCDLQMTFTLSHLNHFYLQRPCHVQVNNHAIASLVILSHALKKGETNVYAI